MTLKNIRTLGRYTNLYTRKAYNIRKGTNIARGTDHIYYLYRGERVFITDADFYSIYKKQP